MKWRVTKTGVGAGVYDDVKVGQGGALLCFENRGEKPYEGASSEFVVQVLVACYSPGMWVSAERIDS